MVSSLLRSRERRSYLLWCLSPVSGVETGAGATVDVAGGGGGNRVRSVADAQLPVVMVVFFHPFLPFTFFTMTS